MRRQAVTVTEVTVTEVSVSEVSVSEVANMCNPYLLHGFLLCDWTDVETDAAFFLGHTALAGFVVQLVDQIHGSAGERGVDGG